MGLKTQEFMNAVCAVQSQEFPIFSFTESDGIQHRLSQYIHTYAVPMADMVFGSDYMKAAFPAIDDAVAFAKANLVYNPDRNTYAIGNVDMTTLPQWAKDLLEEWKASRIKDRAVLTARITEDGEKHSAASNDPGGTSVNTSADTE